MLVVAGGDRLFWVLLVSGVLLAMIIGFVVWAVLTAYGGPPEPPATPPLEELAARGHEIRDAQPRIVIGFLVILTITSAFILVASVGLYHAFMGLDVRENQPPGPELPVGDQTPPRPRLQADATLDFNRFKAKEEERLNSYGWVNSAEGIARIPIRRAMALIAKQGLPVAEGEPQTTLSTPRAAPPAANTSATPPRRKP